MKARAPSEQADSESESDEVGGSAADVSAEKGKELSTAAAGESAATASAFEQIAEAQASAGDMLGLNSCLLWPMKARVCSLRHGPCPASSRLGKLCRPHDISASNLSLKWADCASHTHSLTVSASTPYEPFVGAHCQPVAVGLACMACKRSAGGPCQEWSVWVALQVRQRPDQQRIWSSQVRAQAPAEGSSRFQSGSMIPHPPLTSPLPPMWKAWINLRMCW